MEIDPSLKEEKSPYLFGHSILTIDQVQLVLMLPRHQDVVPIALK